MTTRRTLIKGFAGLSVLSSCQNDKQNDSGLEAISVRPDEPSPWLPSGEISWELFPFGIQVGDPAEESVVVAIHTSLLEITWVLVEQDDDSWIETRRKDVVIEGGYYRLDLEGLTSDTAYSIVANSSTGERSQVTRFRTALGSDDWRIVTFGATSCLRRNLPWENLSRAAEEQYDFFGLLGDTVYTNSRDEEGAWDDWAYALTRQGLRELTASTALIPTWDDHELVNNFDWGLIADADVVHENALRLFHKALPNRSNPNGGIYRKISQGRVLDIFVLDCRGERNSEQSIYISEDQMEWLKNGLESSTARFKIIFNSVPITDFYDLLGDVESIDRWQGFPEQRSEILSHIEESNIDGVLWVSGDFHFGLISQVSPLGQSGDSMMEVLVGPSGSFLNIMGDLLVTTDQYQQRIAAWCHTRFECNPATGEILIQYILDDGTIGMERRLEV